MGVAGERDELGGEGARRNAVPTWARQARISRNIGATGSNFVEADLGGAKRFRRNP